MQRFHGFEASPGPITSHQPQPTKVRGGGAGLVVSILALILLPTVSAAQISGDAVRQRYQRQQQGSANIDEQVRKLRSDDPVERLEGVKGLQNTNDTKAFEFLIQAIGDKDVRVRVKAIEALADMRATVATPVLVQHLFLTTTETPMKQRILAALGEIGDPAAARPIIEFLQRDLDSTTRGTAIYALGDIGSMESESTLETIAESDSNPTLQRLANEALAKVHHQHALRSKEEDRPADLFLEPKEPPQ